MEFTLKSSRENPDFAKIVWSQVQYLKYIAEYRELAEPFSFGKNSAYLDDLYNEVKAIVGG